jgi:hypothetical protein
MRNAMINGHITKWSIIHIVLGTLVTAIPFLAFSINILHSFYDVGSSFEDAGWSAYLIYDADFQLHNPPCVAEGMRV